MLTIIVLCNPATPVLEPELVTSLRNAWGGGDAVWLMPDVAAEFSLKARPENFEAVRAELDGMQIDLNCVPAANRSKKLLLADMDSTMIEQECIDELACAAGIGDQVSGITAKAMNGEMNFQTALRARVALLKGLDIGVIDSVLQDRISYMPGGKTLVSTMKANGAYTALVSGGFTHFSGPVADHLGFDEHRSNRFTLGDGVLSGDVEAPIFGRDAKVTALEDLTGKLGIDDVDVLAVGDGANDLGMLARAGMGVALHAKPAVQAQADIRINHGDLTALLLLQGYAADRFHEA